MALTDTIITVARRALAVDKTGLLAGTITREDGVTGFRPDAVTLTITHLLTGAAIVSARDITADVDADGALSTELLPADNALINTEGLTSEQHSALVEWSWGARRGGHRIDFWVKRL